MKQTFSVEFAAVPKMNRNVAFQMSYNTVFLKFMLIYDSLSCKKKTPVNLGLTRYGIRVFVSDKLW